MSTLGLTPCAGMREHVAHKLGLTTPKALVSWSQEDVERLSMEYDALESGRKDRVEVSPLRLLEAHMLDLIYRKPARVRRLQRETLVRARLEMQRVLWWQEAMHLGHCGVEFKIWAATSFDSGPRPTDMVWLIRSPQGRLVAGSDRANAQKPIPISGWTGVDSEVSEAFGDRGPVMYARLLDGPFPSGFTKKRGWPWDWYGYKSNGHMVFKIPLFMIDRQLWLEGARPIKGLSAYDGKPENGINGRLGKLMVASENAVTRWPGSRPWVPQAMTELRSNYMGFDVQREKVKMCYCTWHPVPYNADHIGSIRNYGKPFDM